MNKNILTFGFTFLGLSLLIGGCSQISELPKEVMYGSAPKDEWSRIWPLQLQFEGDTVVAEARGHLTDATFWVRYDLTAPESIRMVVCGDGYENKESSDTLTLKLFGGDGKPVGKGAYGLYEVQKRLPRKVKLEDNLVYRVWPVGDSTGITEVGVIFGNASEFPIRLDFLK